MVATFPQKFGKYVLLRKIATGGMAEIFQGKTAGAEGFEKDLVIKRILPHFSEDEAFVKMFIDEASLTAKLQHANIVQIFDFDLAEGAYYIAMEYIEGEDLSSVLKDGHAAGRPLSVAQCVWVTMELAKGLHYAHVKEHKGKPLNIIHRDISPHNAMIAYNGEVKLMDFGIAKAAERSTKTQAGTVKGKVAYMSPEQARGKPLDARSDLFALATVLWEMLTFRRLFLRDSDFETLTAVLKEPAEPPSRVRPGIDQELDDIILTALEKDRDQRQKNVEEFNRELTRWYYKHVNDLEAEKLRPYMQQLYSGKIHRLRAELAEVDPTQRGAERPRGAAEAGHRPEPSRVQRAEPARPEPSRVQRAEPVRPEQGRAQRPEPPRPEPARPARSEPAGRGAGGRGAPGAGEMRLSSRPEPSEPAMTIDEPVPDILRAVAPRSHGSDLTPAKDAGRRGASAKDGAKGAKEAAKPAKSPAQYFSAPETLMEKDGPSQAEVLAALRASRGGGAPSEAAPDMTIAGRVKAPEPRGKPGIVVILAVVMLVLGGIIAFVVAP